ncbi:MAG: RNA polymerase sigma factor [Flavobacteriaceae bacterium]
MGNADKIFDGLLVLQFRSGQTKAISLLVKRYQMKLCKHAFWYIKDVDVAKDIVQDSWSVMIRKMNTLKDPNSFGSWAMRIVTRKSLDYLNQNRLLREKQKELYNQRYVSEAEDREEDQLESIRAALKQLTNAQKTVMRLFYIEGYSLNEISEILEISTGTVKSRLFHAREKLKLIIKSKNHEK